ncbi:MAG: alpha/beta hydrolase, partial [Anaerocolumna sp.]|nr:alpha/beta hydrolase [Anaerocolumna sp.]
MEQIKLDYKIMGQGKQVIVFENGLGSHNSDWHFIVEEIKSDAVVITYHRAGYGESMSSCSTRTTGQIAEELNSMLNEIGLKNKIILVGHSFGGLCVQHFAKLYPDKVKGIVLVDSTSADFGNLYSLDLPVLFSHIAIDKLIEKWCELSNKTVQELQHLMHPVLSKEQLQLPEALHETIEEFSTNPVTFKTMATETDYWKLSSEQIKSIVDFPDIPLYVIARDSEVSVRFYTERGIPEAEAVAYEDTWRKLQVEHSQLSKKGKLIIAEGSDHIVQLEKPDIVVNCIRE